MVSGPTRFGSLRLVLPAGCRRMLDLPVPLGYLPTTTIGTLVYTGGGADITGGTLTDEQISFVYDPVADSINTIADIPTPQATLGR